MKLELYGLIQSILEAGGKIESGRYILRNGNGELHRDDGPALITPNGTQHWYRNGELHRDDGPAVVYPDGSRDWYRNGRRHRDDGPALIYPDGRKHWYIDGTRIYSTDPTPA